ncbi:hypothetical protein [Streptomyces sp. NPDC006784]|uniref:hypothetical protein n=1 Tax=Streptomyces sp. NPDC006784 TaxID=3364764 RepID=UPI0036989EEC
MPKVRTTMQPHLDIEVSDAAYLDLKRQGLLLEERPSRASEPTTSPAAAPAKTPPAPAPAGKSSKE